MKSQYQPMRIRNFLTGKVVRVYPSTDSVDSSYGLECWVDRAGNSYGQCQFGIPFGFTPVLSGNDVTGVEGKVMDSGADSK
jgi:dTDP-D-glucose 4,6-dehydratase